MVMMLLWSEQVVCHYQSQHAVFSVMNEVCLLFEHQRNYSTQTCLFIWFHSDISMNNITELPAFVFRNLPYLEEL